MVVLQSPAGRDTEYFEQSSGRYVRFFAPEHAAYLSPPPCLPFDTPSARALFRLVRHEPRLLRLLLRVAGLAETRGEGWAVTFAGAAPKPHQLRTLGDIGPGRRTGAAFGSTLGSAGSVLLGGEEGRVFFFFFFFFSVIFSLRLFFILPVAYVFPVE
jgi:hypothetical protein